MDPNQKSRTRRSITAIMLATLTTFALVASTPAGAAPPDDGGWNIVAPAEQGLDAAALDAADAYAAVPARNTQGVVVVRGGEIVNEWYAPGEGPRSWAASWSVAKSVTGLLVGIAIDRGLIAGVDERDCRAVRGHLDWLVSAGLEGCSHAQALSAGVP